LQDCQCFDDKLTPKLMLNQLFIEGHRMVKCSEAVSKSDHMISE
jgi:hypothetical protein